MDILNEHYNSVYDNGRSSKKMKKHLIQKIKHGLRPEKRSINPNNAAWAVASLLFLCLVLVFVLVYTKPWNERDYYLKEKMASRNNNTGFSLIKNHFSSRNRSWRQLAEQQRSASVSRRLLGPIHEEDEDFMDLWGISWGISCSYICWWKFEDILGCIFMNIERYLGTIFWIFVV